MRRIATFVHLFVIGAASACSHLTTMNDAFPSCIESETDIVPSSLLPSTYSLDNLIAVSGSTAIRVHWLNAGSDIVHIETSVDQDWVQRTSYKSNGDRSCTSSIGSTTTSVEWKALVTWSASAEQMPFSADGEYATEFSNDRSLFVKYELTQAEMLDLATELGVDVALPSEMVFAQRTSDSEFSIGAKMNSTEATSDNDEPDVLLCQSGPE